MTHAPPRVGEASGLFLCSDPRAPTRPVTRVSCELLTSALHLADVNPNWKRKKKKKGLPIFFVFLICSFQVFQMDKNELPKTVTTILNGHNYVLWSQDIRSFLKGHRLWRYVTSEIQAPVRSKDEEDMKFADRLKDWDCKNHQIITWFRHSTVPSIHQQFVRYENAKDV